jgi:hypothetical protein
MFGLQNIDFALREIECTLKERYTPDSDLLHAEGIDERDDGSRIAHWEGLSRGHI